MYRPGRIAPTWRGEALDDLLEKNVLSLLKAAGPNLATEVPNQNGDLAAGLVTKLLALESDNAALKEQLLVLQQQQQQQQQQHKQDQDQQPHSIQQLLQHQQQPAGCACHQQHESQGAQNLQHLQLELQRLRQQCRAAWQQVTELKRFLNDYGLVWVGQPLQLEAGQECDSMHCGADAHAASHDDSPGTEPAMVAVPQADPAPASCTAAARLPFELSELQQCLDELNRLAGDGVSQLQQLGGAPASLAASSSSRRGTALQLFTPEPVKLAVFSDGLMLHQCPPLPYSSEAADSILSDIFDGYFPSALRSEFPDGIPFQLVDRSNQTLEEATATAASAAAQKGSNIIGWQDLEAQQLQGLPGLAVLSGPAFLDRLPKTVIVHQQVISVRPVVERFITGSSRCSTSSGIGGKIYIRPSSGSGATSHPASQGAAAIAAGQQSSSAGVAIAAQQQQQQATVQIKSEDGKETYVLMLPYTATIAALRASINKHRASTGATCYVCQQQPRQQQQQQLTSAAALALGSESGSSPVEGNPASSQSGECCGYELRSAFPARLYADGNVTLQQAGLVPSATLFMRHMAA